MDQIAALRVDDYLSRADCMRRRTWARGRMRVLWAAGSMRSVLIPPAGGMHSIRRTKPTLIYRRTRNLRAVQLLLGHTSLKAPCGTSASRSTTLSRSPTKPKSDAESAVRPGAPHEKTLSGQKPTNSARL